jgi:hypothetical protein
LALDRLSSALTANWWAWSNARRSTGSKGITSLSPIRSPRVPGETPCIYTLLSIASSPSVSCHSPRRRRVSPMPPPESPVLQQLDRLDGSSSEFPDQLCNVLYGKEYIQCVRNIHDDDVVWLIDYLDEVCHRNTFPAPLIGWRRLSMVSIHQVTRSGSVCKDSVAYVALGGHSQHRTRFRPTF